MSGARGARGGRELFVWYRVEREQAIRLQRDVESMQRALELAHPGLRARLLIRADGTGTQTWMETYAMQAVDAAGIDDAIRSRIEAAAAPLRDRMTSDRHVEAFDTIDRA